MKFSIDRKDLVARLTNFVAKGQLNYSTKISETMKSAYIYATDDKVCFIGREDDTASVFCRFEIDAKVEESGEMFYPDLLVLFSTIKDMNGNTVTMIFTESVLNISDGVEEMTFGIAKMVGFKEIVDWDNMNVYDGKNVVWSHKDKRYTYTNWFSVEEGSSLREISDRVLSKTATSLVVFDTTEGSLVVSAENTQLTRSFKKRIDAEVHSKERLVISNLFPILKQLRGKVEFKYYIKTDGTLHVWIVNGEYEWMVRYKEVQIP